MDRPPDDNHLQEIHEKAAQLVEFLIATRSGSQDLLSLEELNIRLSTKDAVTFATTFARLIEREQRITSDDKERALDFLWKRMFGVLTFHIYVINKTNGAKQMWRTSSLVTLKDTLTANYGATRNLRCYFKGKTLFLSSCAKKSMGDLGFQKGDTLMIEEIPITKPANPAKQKTNSGSTDTPRIKRPIKTPSNSKSARVFRSPPMTTEDYRTQHSIRLSKVFNQAEPIFSAIKRKLDVKLQRHHREQLQHNRKKVEPSIKVEFSSHNLNGKAGKSIYPILIGSPNHLYSSRKKTSSCKSTRAIDLHGCSCKEAIEMLDQSLPVLVEDAMNDDHWVVPVDIICGCGSQTLSQAVEQWIRSSRHVSNRPKSF